MSTFMANAATVERKWYVVDAQGKSLGRLAADVAPILNGKHKVDYTPHVDCGDFVIVVNADKVVLTGNKLTQKYYRCLLYTSCPRRRPLLGRRGHRGTAGQKRTDCIAVCRP